MVGVIRGVPRAERLEAERAITNAFSNIQTQDCLRAEALRLAREMTERTFVEIPPNPMPESTTNASGVPMPLALAGAQPRPQTVLELRVLSLELGGQERPYINPGFHLIARAQAQLIDPANGKVLYTYGQWYSGKRHMKFTEWAASAEQLRDEFRTTCQEIARDMIEHLFKTE